ncbi:5'-deoxynucleotidase [Paraferrimonas sp. SM1919]|uniref:5'-deoxynucleotidase n=1 Tax=Paraferrimonas sp. SM1919 TaxID=2662263 RepID=UPI0013D3C381|nr:5'-deoxynucleotidase [Paraferrimonas sp. SM1919]
MSHLFAQLARMKLINRWPLMHNVHSENIQEHSLQVAMVAHGLALIANEHYQGNYDPYKMATLALFHDASEIITGDLPTPVKYFNAEITAEYKKIEAIAEQRLISMAPIELQPHYEKLINSSLWGDDEKLLLKSADTICAYIKCLEEIQFGNHEFITAKNNLQKALDQNPLSCVQYFRETYLNSFSLTLDELNEG